jgi:hypothetical protein
LGAVSDRFLDDTLQRFLWSANCGFPYHVHHILEACPTVEVFSYKMPTYKMGNRRLHMAAWKHRVSIYGWKAQGNGGFTRCHPELPLT